MRFEYFQSTSDELWYWRLKVKNGEIIADGSEGYASKANVLRAIENFCQSVRGASRKEVNA